MLDILKPAIDFIKLKLGNMGMFAVSFFALGVVCVTQYEKYVVTPKALIVVEQKLDTKIGFVELRVLRVEKSQFLKEQYDLEDVIYDIQQNGGIVKPRILNRVAYVKQRLDELSKAEEALIKYLQDKDKKE